MPKSLNLSARLPVLDGLRGYAILLVLWHHGPSIFDAPLTLYARPFWRWSASGWIGVDLFFVLSGFLITRILIDTRSARSQLVTFWSRRALRIFPLAYLYLLAVFCSTKAFGLPPLLVSFHEWSWFLLYAGNLRIAFRGWLDGSLAILWSLAIEEQFYALWPVAVRLFNDKLLVVFSLLLVIASPILRAVTFAKMGFPAVFVATWCRLDTMAAGALLAIAVRSRWRIQVLGMCRLLALPALGLLCWSICKPFGMLYPGQYPKYFPIYGYSWLALSFAILVGLALEPGWAVRVFMGSLPLRYLGRISYGIYLWHFFVGQILQTPFVHVFGKHQHIPMQIGLWLLATIAIASVSWFGFERPILHLKRRLPFSGSPSSSSRVER